MSRHSSDARLTEALRLRVTAEEKSGLKRLAAELGEKPSRVLRHALREAINGEPEYFASGVSELREAHRELAAVGRNLNQIARRMNSYTEVFPEELAAELERVRREVRAVDAVYRGALARVSQRRVSAGS